MHRLRHLREQLQANQLDLENLAGVGYKTAAIETLSDIILGGAFMGFVGVGAEHPTSYERALLTKDAADSLDKLRRLQIPAKFDTT